MKLLGGDWSKGDFIAALCFVVGIIACAAAILAIPGMPKFFHWDNDPKQSENRPNGAPKLQPPISSLELSAPTEPSHKTGPPTRASNTRPRVPTPEPASQPAPGSGGFLGSGNNSGNQNSGSQVCSPGVVNCNFAPNQGHQETYYGARVPAPAAGFSQSALPPVDVTSADSQAAGMDSNELSREGYYKANPGEMLLLWAADDFTSPAFRVECDHVCKITFAAIETHSSSGSIRGSDIGYRLRTVSGDASGVYVLFSAPNGVLEQGQVIRCRVRSLTPQPVTIVSVNSFNRH